MHVNAENTTDVGLAALPCYTVVANTSLPPVIGRIGSICANKPNCCPCMFCLTVAVAILTLTV